MNSGGVYCRILSSQIVYIVVVAAKPMVGGYDPRRIEDPAVDRLHLHTLG